MTEGDARERTLAVILHADVVGSTALVQRDEGVAHRRITDAFARFAAQIDAYRGTVHEVRGDALVAQFARASDAVCAAAAFQQENSVRNAALDDGVAPAVRAGIALGEVVIADGTVTGAGVVLAQRVEQLAAPGGICVTGAVHEAVPSRLPFDYDDLGPQRLKGFDAPVHVRAVVLREGEALPPPGAATARAGSTKRRLGPGTLALAAAVLVAVLGAVAWMRPWHTPPPADVPSPATASVARADKPSIAVMPFDNLGGAAEDEKFSDGIAENIIATLGRIPQLLVMARNATFQYKGKAVAPAEVARALDVRYLLEGSLQRAGDRIRVTAKLVDAASSEQLWSQVFDRDLDDFFAVQDEITLGVVTALQIKLVEGETSLLSHGQTASIEAWAKMTESRRLFFEFTAESNRRARRLAEEAIAIDPGYAFAYNAVAWEHFLDVTRGWSGDPAQSMALARSHVARALELDPAIGVAHTLVARIALMEGRPDEARTHARRALDAEPGSASVHWNLAPIMIGVGDYRAAVMHAQMARRLFPNQTFTVVAGIRTYEAWGRHLLGEHAEALRVADEVLAGEPDDTTRLRMELVRVASLAAGGDVEGARAAAAALRSHHPGFTLASPRGGLPTELAGEDREAVIDRLAAAGVPAGSP